MLTSKFAYLPELDAPLDCHSSLVRKGYVQTWWSKRLDIPQEYWNSRSNCGEGWYRYTKVIPYTKGLGPEDIPWPEYFDLFNRQISWNDYHRKPYIKVGGRK